MGHSVLVNVLLEEGDVQAAWEAAHDGGCVEEATKRDGYEQAVSLLTEVSECYKQVGASAEIR